MATVPSGYSYWNKSADKYYLEGQSIPAAGEGDLLYPKSGAPAKTNFSYTFHNARTVKYTWYDNDSEQEVYISAGWEVDNTDSNNDSLSTTMLSSFNGYNVVSIVLKHSHMTQLTLPSNCQFVSMPGSKLTKINGSFPTSLKYLYFYNSTELVSVPSMSSLTNITHCMGLFNNCTKLTTVPSLPPNATTFHRAFENCTSLVNAPAIPSKAVLTGMMFKNCTSLKNTPINNSNVSFRMSDMFYECTSLTSAANFNIPASMYYGYRMFDGCTSLETPPPVVRGTDALAYRMFEGCTALKTAPVFEGTFTNLNTCFWKCSALKQPPIVKHISNCEMSWMFAECTSLETVPELPKNVLSLYYMFYKCTSLTWVSLYIPTEKQPSVNYMFNGCTNLTGIIWLDYNGDLAHNKMFEGTEKPIVLWGSHFTENLPVYASTTNNNNVHVGLFANCSDSISAVRCDINGKLDDKGDYTKLTIQFTAPLLTNSKLYCPKVYIKNAQQAPVKNWTLKYMNGSTETTKTIANSTSITAERIEANALVASGTFETLFNAINDSIYSVYIPTSCSECTTGYDSSGNLLQHQTYYWNGTAGQAIFTGDTYIWDALPDGSGFKIGGAIIEDAGETGFIVGDEIALEADQYPSKFNGPVTFNGSSTFNNNLYIDIDENASTGTTDGDLYNLIVNILRWNDVFN